MPLSTNHPNHPMSSSPKQIQLHDKHFGLSYPGAEILHDIQAVAERINHDFKGHTGQPPIFLCMLNGAFMFAAHLLGRIGFACEVSFVKFSSYRGTQSCGEVQQLIGLNGGLAGRTVIVVEDIVETGSTLTTLHAELRKQGAAQIRVASMLLKPNRYSGPVPVDYVGRIIPDDFIVGFGLDYNGLGRNLPDIYTLIP